MPETTINKRTVRVLKIFTVLFFIFTNANLSAQWRVGMHAGIMRNTFKTDISNLINTRYRPQQGPVLGFAAFHCFNHWFAVQSGIEYMQKNTRLERTGFYEGIYVNSRNHYFQIPVLARFEFGNSKWRGFVNAGSYGSYWAASARSGVYADIFSPQVQQINAQRLLGVTSVATFKEKYRIDAQKDNRWEVGYIVGLGVSYNIKSRLLLFLQSRYSYAITNRYKQSNLFPQRAYNEGAGLSAGVLYQLKIRKEKK